MMTDIEFKNLKDKIEAELPIRLKLAELAGMPKINVKNYKALEDFDLTIRDLFIEVMLRKPENVPAAHQLIAGFRK